MYENLTKVYYKNPQNHTKIYQERFNGENTVKLPMHIKAWKGNTHQLFYVNTSEITTLITKIYETIIKNNELSRLISDDDNSAFMNYYRNEMLVEEILSTNKIEGIRRTRKDLIEAEKKVKDNSKPPRLHFVLNKYKKLQNNENIKLENAEDLRTVYDEFISNEIEEDNKLDGILFRKEGVSVLDSRGNGDIVHTGIVNEENIIQEINILLSYMNDNQESPRLIKTAIFQYHFGYIHPFYDGNGRVSRYLMSNYIKEIDSLLSFKVSKIILDNVQLFYNLFDETNQELNKGDMTPFITGILKLFLLGVEEINNELNKYNFLFRNFWDFIEEDVKYSSLDKFTIDVLFIIYQATIYQNELSLADIQRNTNSGYTKVRNHVNILMNLSLVERTDYKNYKVIEEVFLKINNPI